MTNFKTLINRFSSGIVLIMLAIPMVANAAGEDKLNVEFEKYVMPNGLQVVLHTDHSDPMISFAIMYHTGSSRETPGKTGFAHLFEHLLFGGSENASPGTFDKVIEAAGGSNNGFTSRDVTAYYETFPNNALEKILWLESDRMGFFINSVTPRLLAIQQNVVQNEKRQGEDNSPYGFTDYVVLKNLYPSSHPYSWEVIGEMDDLKNATLNDVKKYYQDFYGPNNATIVIAGDFDPETAKSLMNKYFGEIKSHGEVMPRTSQPVNLDKTVKVYHEDNFANVPEINLVWPATKVYTKDAYALDFLSKILTDGKKAPLYKVLVRDKKLTSRMGSYNDAGELTGDFHISARANQGVTLKEIESAIFEAFKLFEKDGITNNDIERIKAVSEKNFYNGIEGVNDKSLQLAAYNTFMNDPGYIVNDIENIKAVTKEDVIRVYEKYIKGKPHVVTSFVPKGKLDLAVENSVPSNVKEENISEAAQVEIAEAKDAAVNKTASAIDRTKEPKSGKEPQVNVPTIWKATLKNGIEVSGIFNRELPTVDINMVIDGGVFQDKIELPGVCNMVAKVLPQGTKNKTPEELEEETKLLGSDIRFSSSNEELTMYANTLSRNFGKTVDLMKEMLLEPRWDSTEFSIARMRTKNQIIQSEAQPGSVASKNFLKLLYGTNHILGYSNLGTKESIDKIQLDDLKAYYEKNVSPSVTKIQIAGNISKEQALAALVPLERDWVAKRVDFNKFAAPANPEKSQIYFIDMPGSSQSVIFLGYLAISRSNPDFVKTDFINYRLGGSFTSILNQILREEKGFTYGASSRFIEQMNIAPFMASTSVRSDATFETMQIFKNEMEKYRKGISKKDLQYIKDCMIRSNALRFESNGALVKMLYTMEKFGLSDDYIKQEEKVMKSMTVKSHKSVTGKYINPDRMYYVVVGDAATQMEKLENIGFGKPILVSQ